MPSLFVIDDEGLPDDSPTPIRPIDDRLALRGSPHQHNVITVFSAGELATVLARNR